MASLDLGTLKVGIKVDGANKAKEDLKGVSSETSNAGKSAESTKGKMKSLSDGFMDAVKNTKVFGVSLGDLASGLGDSATQSALLGGAMAGIVTAGIQIATQAVAALIGKLVELTKQTYEVGVAFQAQMSRVAAIVGATGEKAQQLTDIAKKFGAETVFSSTEAGKALEYMGMAGWKTQQMLDGMPGILSLAAASGEDLAMVSDIVTDGLTAFGESADQASRMADVLAAAATNSNTNVSKMGLTMQYAAPLAGALSYSMEDVAVAAGLMANAGIKGEKSGTALRSMFSELLGTIEITGDQLGKYVIETENADGSMRELSEIIVDLRKAFADLTESEQAANAESLVGREAMSGFLAVVNASETDFNKLTNAINNSAGASSTMAATMTDNISGLQKAIDSKFESIKLSIFNVFEPLISGFLKAYDSMLNVSEKIWKVIGGVLSKITGIITPFVDTIVAIFDTAIDILWPIVEPFFLLLEAALGKNMESLRMLADVVKVALSEVKNAIMPFVEFFNNSIMAIVDIINGDWDSAMDRMKSLSELAVQGIVNIFLILPNTIVGIINLCIDAINNMFGTTFNKMKRFEVDISKLTKTMSGGIEDVADSTSKSMESMADAIDKGFNDAEDSVSNTLDSLNKIYSDYMSKQMSDYEKQLREQYDGGTLREEKKIQEKLALHERMLQKQLEEDEKYEKQRLEMQKKYYTKSVTENGKTTITTTPRYANGTMSAPGGWSVVGETGRELMYVPPRAQIINNNTTEKILSSGNGTTFTGPIYVQANNVQELIDELKMAYISGELV